MHKRMAQKEEMEGYGIAESKPVFKYCGGI